MVKTSPSNAGSRGSIPDQRAKIPMCLGTKRSPQRHNTSTIVTNLIKTFKNGPHLTPQKTHIVALRATAEQINTGKISTEGLKWSSKNIYFIKKKVETEEPAPLACRPSQVNGIFSNNRLLSFRQLAGAAGSLIDMTSCGIIKSAGPSVPHSSLPLRRTVDGIPPEGDMNLASECITRGGQTSCH